MAKSSNAFRCDLTTQCDAPELFAQGSAGVCPPHLFGNHPPLTYTCRISPHPFPDAHRVTCHLCQQQPNTHPHGREQKAEQTVGPSCRRRRISELDS
ncbi:hypothetical protein CDAR_235931 [Caerostris darwini]|uniref:Uncharacterized protein n=1 Tax=Caerostris darwini TaxID=1538125 RepID=A0AAV4UG42_9ARAC|nr:hypothetical protein CDAR_235931 [Caerostris darwini]